MVRTTYICGQSDYDIYVWLCVLVSRLCAMGRIHGLPVENNLRVGLDQVDKMYRWGWVGFRKLFCGLVWIGWASVVVFGLV